MVTGGDDSTICSCKAGDGAQDLDDTETVGSINGPGMDLKGDESMMRPVSEVYNDHSTKMMPPCGNQICTSKESQAPTHRQNVREPRCSNSFIQFFASQVDDIKNLLESREELLKRTTQQRKENEKLRKKLVENLIKQHGQNEELRKKLVENLIKHLGQINELDKNVKRLLRQRRTRIPHHVLQGDVDSSQKSPTIQLESGDFARWPSDLHK